ncbi:MAG: S8 family serine peptidase, partial [Synechococcus sp. BS307-5m-G34]|nr:S8 family serine peptidase [Synechococcus sp. BS307-5m-G34]
YTSNSQESPSVISFGRPLQDLAAHGLTNLPAPLSLSTSITPVNDGPLLSSPPDPLPAAEAGTAVSISAEQLLAGYTDVDGDALSITSLSLDQTSPVNSDAGVISLESSGGWLFTPSAGFQGTVELSFTVSDGVLATTGQQTFTMGSGSGGNGSESNDRLIGSAASDNINGQAGDDILEGLGGDDALNGEAGSDQLRGGAGDDQLSGGDHDDILHGNSGHDAIDGDGGDDQLFGGLGNDVLDGSSGDDIATGDAGDDALWGGQGSDQLYGGAGDDFLAGQDGEDIITAGDGDDWLSGGANSDHLQGEGGNDQLIAIGQTVADDIFDGGEGNDVLITGNRSERGSDFTNAALFSIEELHLLPTNGATNFNDGLDTNDWSTGNSRQGTRLSIDQLELFSLIKATNDQRWSSTEASYGLREHLGNNDWWGNSGQWRWMRVTGDGSINLNDSRWDNDTFFRIQTEDGSQTLIGADNNDWLSAGRGNDELRGNKGNDSLIAGGGSDVIHGGEGNDLLEGNAGHDLIHGGSGDDRLIGGGSHDTVYGEAGSDVVEIYFGSIDDNIHGHRDYWYDNNTTITGRYDGGEGNDTLRIYADNWWGSDGDNRGAGYTIDLREADINNFERLEVGTSAIVRLSGSQYSQFSSGVSTAAGLQSKPRLAIDLAAGEELRFTKNAGLNSASGALKITGTSELFNDTLAINSDVVIDFTNSGTSINGVDVLDVQRGTIKLTAAQWNSFDSVRSSGNATKRIIITDNADLDLSSYSRSADSNTSLELNLSVEQINAEPMALFAKKFNSSSNSQVEVNVLGNGNINSQDWPLSINFNANQATFAEYSADGDQDDNNFELRLLGPFNLNGQGGEDTLTLNAKSDLTEGNLSSIEILDLNDQQVRMTSSQFNSFNKIINSGEIHLLDSNHFNSNLIVGGNDNTSSGITIHQPTSGIETIHHFGTADNDNRSADSSIQVDLTSLTASGSGSVATPNWSWVDISDDLNITLQVHPSSEDGYSLAWHDWHEGRRYEIQAYRLQGGDIPLSNVIEENKFNRFNNHNWLNKNDVIMILGAFDKALFIRASELTWVSDGSPENRISLNYWTADLNPSVDHLYGLDGDDQLAGGIGDDQLVGGPGNDRLDGGSGFNSAVFSDIQSRYTVSFNDNDGSGVTVEHLDGGADGTDTLIDIQKLIFADSDFKLDDVTNRFDLIAGPNAELGKPIQGTIDYQDDRDSWTLPLAEDSKIRILRSNADHDTRARIEGTYNFGDWEQDRTYTVDSSGLHTLDVRGQDGAEYSFTVLMADDGSADTSTEKAFANAQDNTSNGSEHIRGFIGFQQVAENGLSSWDTADSDWIRVDLVQGIQYEFQALGAASLPSTGLNDPYLQRLLDPAITLHSPDGKPLVDGASSTNGSDPLIVYRAEQSGAHYLAVSSESGLATGSYAVTRSSLDEFGGDINTNGLLTIERPIQGVINQPGDQDWFRITLNAGEALVLELLGNSSNNGTLHDPWLGLYSASGQLLASDNNNGKGLDARLAWAASTAGTYYIAAAALGNQGRGSYILQSSKREDDAPDRLSSAFVYDLITPGTSLSGDLEVSGDRDWYQTILQATKTYRIALDGEQSLASGYQPLNDPAVTVRGPGGKRLAFDDDGGVGLDAELIFQPASTGRFFLDVQDATDRSDGHYKLSVEEAVDDFGDTTLSAHALSQPGKDAVVLEGRLDFRQDIDLFSIDISPDQTYRIDLRGLSSDGGSLPDPLLLIHALDGTLLSDDDNSGQGNDAGLYLSSSTAQTILITAAAPAGQLGTYTLEIEQSQLPPDDFGDSPDQAGSLTPGTSQQGLLLTAGDTDWFQLALKADQHYRFLLRGTDSNSGSLDDPFLELRDADGTLIDSADGGTLTRDAALGYRPSSDQTVHLVARASTSALTGSYTLTAYEPDEAGAGFESAAPLLVDAPFQAGIQSPDDTDWFRIDVTAGNTYTLSALTDTDKDGSLKTALIELFDSTRTTISAADGRHTDGSATLAFKATSTGPHYLAVRGYRGDTGTYTLSATQGNQADLIGESRDTAAALTIGGDNRAVLELASDLDWFSVDVDAGSTYRFTMQANVDGITSPLVAPSLTTVAFEADELPPTPPSRRGRRRLPGFLGENAISLDSSITYTAEQSGTLYLQAASVANRWQGAYRIEAVDLGDLNRDDHPDTSSGSAPTLLPGQSRTGTIENSTDRDIFRLALKGNQSYQLLLRGVSSNGGTLTDPRFRILDAAGKAVSASFDSVGAPDPSLLFTPATSGDFFLEVAAEEGNTDIGSYSADLIAITQGDQTTPLNDLPADRYTTAELLAKQTVESTLHSGDDTDWIRVELTAGESYQFDLTPRINQGGLGWTPHIDLIDSDGARLAASRDNAPGQTARLLYRPSSDGHVFLAISSKDGSHGTYELNRRRLVSSSGDPLIARQWHLSNATGNGLDLNLDAVWRDYSGSDINIGVIDDGILYSHPDLTSQLDTTNDAGASFSFPDVGSLFEDANLNVGPKPEAGHGTAVAGLIAAGSANGAGLSGVAPGASISGYEVDWTPQALTLMLQKQLDSSIGGVDLSNNSWGFLRPFADDFDSPQFSPLVQALTNGVQQGRDNGTNALGINWVFSAGNSRTLGDSTNYHGFQSSRFVTTVASTDRRGNTSFFSTPGASILVSAFGEDLYTSLLGAENTAGYGNFDGTSAAAPLVSGVIALMLEANPDLGYRDVQTILAYSARQVIDDGFKFNAASNWNGGGLHISHDQGFGLVDAHSAVRLAESWSAAPSTSANEQRAIQSIKGSAAIPDNSVSGVSLSTLIDRALDLEWAEVELDILHPRITDLVVELISPSGTVARLINRPTVSPTNPSGDSAQDGLPDRIVFSTSASLFRGESSLGNWTLKVSDRNKDITGTLRQWGLNLYGSQPSDDDTYIYTNEYQTVSDATRSLLIDNDKGIDTFNGAALSTATLLNLTPGSKSRVAMRPLSLGDDTVIEHAITGDGDDVIRGNASNNSLRGGRGDDRFFLSAGSDTLDGGRGFDQLIVEANASDFLLTEDTSSGNWTITDQRPSTTYGHTGTDLLTSIERIVFFDHQQDLITNNQPPTLAGTVEDLAFDSDVVFTHTFSNDLFTDPDNLNASADDLAYDIRMTDGRQLPGWLKFDPTSGSLTGEPHPAASGTYSLEILATDSLGAVTAQSFSLNIEHSTGTTGSSEPTDDELAIAWNLELASDSLQVGEDLSVGDIFSIDINVADITDPDNPRSPFSAYADLTYDPAILRAIDISYEDAFPLFRSGEIDPIAGTIQDLGATLASFSPSQSTEIASVRFEVISPGTAEIALSRSQSEFLESTVFESDGDQGPYSRFDSTSLSFSSPRPDIAIKSFQLDNQRLRQGLANFTYDIANYGHVDSLPFWIELHHTTDLNRPLTQDTLIWNQYFAADSITGLSSTGITNQSVAIERDVLFENARSEDPAFLEIFGTSSIHRDWLHLRIQPEQEDADALASNNLAARPIQYFPWDVDDNGKVTTADAVEMVNRIGPTPAATNLTPMHDLNGDGFVDQTEVMEVVNRIGMIQSDLSA